MLMFINVEGKKRIKSVIRIIPAFIWFQAAKYLADHRQEKIRNLRDVLKPGTVISAGVRYETTKESNLENILVYTSISPIATELIKDVVRFLPEQAI